MALAARSHADVTVAGYDASATALAEAVGCGAVDVACDDVATAVSDADVVFVAAPVLVDLGGKKAFNDAAAGPDNTAVKTKPAIAKH